MIDISEMNKAEVLAKLYNASKPQGLGFLHSDGTDTLSISDAADLIVESKRLGDRIYFDYLNGRVMKVNLSGDEFDPRLYDRDNGEGAAARALGI